MAAGNVILPNAQGKVVKATNPIVAVAKDATSLAGSAVATRVAVKAGATWLRSSLSLATKSPFPWLKLVGLGGMAALSLADVWQSYRSARTSIGNMPDDSDVSTMQMKATASATTPPISGMLRNLNRSTLLGFALSAIGNMNKIDPVAFARGVKLGDNYGPLEGAVILTGMFDPGLIYIASQLNQLLSNPAAAALTGQRQAAKLAVQTDSENYRVINEALARLMGDLVTRLTELRKNIAKVSTDLYSAPATTDEQKKQKTAVLASLKKIVDSARSIQQDMNVELRRIKDGISQLQTVKVAASQTMSKQDDDLRRLATITSDTLRTIFAIMANME